MNIFHLLFQSAAGHSVSSGSVLRPPIPQVMEVTGSESPSTLGWSFMNQRARHDLSRGRLRAIESSLENGQVWVPSSPAHRKTWEEEVIFIFIISFVVFIINDKGKISTYINHQELYLLNSRVLK